jgi:hypothetical protein
MAGVTSTAYIKFTYKIYEPPNLGSIFWVPGRLCEAPKRLAHSGRHYERPILLPVTTESFTGQKYRSLITEFPHEQVHYEPLIVGKAHSGALRDPIFRKNEKLTHSIVSIGKIIGPSKKLLLLTYLLVIRCRNSPTRNSGYYNYNIIFGFVEQLFCKL